MPGGVGVGNVLLMTKWDLDVIYRRCFPRGELSFSVRKSLSFLGCINGLVSFSQSDPTSQDWLDVFAMIPVHLADDWKRE